MADWKRRSPVRIIWLGWRYRHGPTDFGDGSYYGWRLMGVIGPFVVCIWPTRNR